jgi:hypothetical protein
MEARGEKNLDEGADTMRRVTIFVAVLLASGANAITPLDRAGSMAANAGTMIGAAAGCGMSEARLDQVSRKMIKTIHESGESTGSLGRVPSIFDYFVARAAAAAKLRPDLCPSAIAAFETAEHP